VALQDVSLSFLPVGVRGPERVIWRMVVGRNYAAREYGCARPWLRAVNQPPGSLTPRSGL